ncbi:MAG: hypothetical protein KF729_37600 [Sandaracinaceae bacterium]|nr:hypothetical protein [Sandaracinaceae bacterium]
MGEPAPHDLLSVRSWLDEALVGLRTIEEPAPSLELARTFLSLALKAVYEGCRDGVDHPTVVAARKRAEEFTREALEGLQANPIDDDAMDQELRLIARALSALSDPSLGPPAPGLAIPHGRERPPLMAGTNLPRLHDPARQALYPTIPLAERDAVVLPEVDPDAPPPFEVPAIHTLEELLAYAASVEGGVAEPAPPSEPPRVAPRPDPLKAAEIVLFGAAIPEQRLVYERARVHFEDIAMFSLLRKGDHGDIWHQLEPVERRLNARVDSILAHGVELIPRLIQLLEDRPVPDPELLWAAVFLLGCIDGDDTRDQILRLVQIAPLDDEEHFEPLADVLTLVPHWGVERFARQWLGSPDPHRVALGLRVLGMRRATVVETALPFLSHDHPRVVEEAARALERVSGELREDDLRIALRHDDPVIFAAALETAIVRGFRGAVLEAEYRLKRGANLPHAALMLALTSDEKELDLVFALAATDPSPMVFETLGWLGQTSIVPFLLGRLRDGDVAAVRALQRLTGASLTKDITVRLYPAEDRPFQRDHFVEPPHELVLSDDADVWEAHWERWGAPAREDRRYRFGHEWTTRDDYWEMAEGYAADRERRLAYLELCARSGGSLPFDPHAWVAWQRPQLEAWRDYLGPHHARAPRGLWTSRLTR